MECHVFIDNSNLWLEGQRLKGKKLKDTDIDHRFRVDLAKLKRVVTKDRRIANAFLYGSRSPASNKADQFWKAAEEKGFAVKIYERSAHGSEKEVDTAMTADIVDLAGDTFYARKADVAIFIIVTGDRDLRPPIEKVIKREIHVELWSWGHSMSHVFKELDRTEELFTSTALNPDSIGYLQTEFGDREINPEHTNIMYNYIPKGRESYHKVRDHMFKLDRLFYIKCTETIHTQNLIITFPHASREELYKEVYELGEFEFTYVSITGIAALESGQ